MSSGASSNSISSLSNARSSPNHPSAKSLIGPRACVKEEMNFSCSDQSAAQDESDDRSNHPRNSARVALSLLSPGSKIVRIERDAKQIRRNEPELCGSNPDQANNCAICTGDDPALP